MDSTYSKLRLKFIEICKGPESQNNFEKEKESWRLVLSDFKSCCTAVAVNTMWYQQRTGSTGKYRNTLTLIWSINF